MKPGWFGPNQYKNTANPEAHFRTTGPEIWKQTGGKITHFFASLGTCGTISGTGRFLKGISKGRVKVHGVHPTAKHDIPGVRSLPQLTMTQHYDREKYDELAEVTNEEAFEMCKRLNQEESIIAGPSSGMQVVGAMRLMKDEPGNVGVIIFCDDIFKYTTSCTRHVPSVFPPEQQGAQFEPAELTALKAAMGLAESGPDTAGPEELAKLKEAGLDDYKIIDVRPPDEFGSRARAKGAINVPLTDLTGQDPAGEIEQVYNLPGAVRKANNKRQKVSPKDALQEALRKALGSLPASNANMMVI
jgi:rhodanese-related sulfurtransferase